jgi:hypothetical protein
MNPVMAGLAFYSIESDAAPFKLKSKHFIPLIICIMLVVQILFYIVQHLSNPTLHKRIRSWLPSFHITIPDFMNALPNKNDDPDIEDPDENENPIRIQRTGTAGMGV